MEEIKRMIEEELATELETLKEMNEGTEQYKTQVECIAKLTDRLIEIEKAENENADKQTQMEAEGKDRIIRNVLNAIGIVLPVGVTIWGTLKTLKFEESGTVTTIMGRGFINKLLPKK